MNIINKVIREMKYWGGDYLLFTSQKKGWSPSYMKSFLEIGKKKPNNPTEKKAKNIYRQSTKTQMTPKYMMSASLIRRKIQIKTALW